MAQHLGDFHGAFGGLGLHGLGGHGGPGPHGGLAHHGGEYGGHEDYAPRPVNRASG